MPPAGLGQWPLYNTTQLLGLGERGRGLVTGGTASPHSLPLWRGD